MAARPSIYANLYVRRSNRALRTPRVGRWYRPRQIAWAGPDAFTRDRFYELDSWYKARIQKPEILPELYLIDPDRIQNSLDDRMPLPNRQTYNVGFKKLKTPQITQKRHDEETLKKNALNHENKIEIDESDFDMLPPLFHYGIFDDLFMKGIFFHNTQSFNATFSNNKSDLSEIECCVKYGNFIKPSNATIPPNVAIEVPAGSSGKAYNSLLVVNIDGDGFCSDEDVPNPSTEVQKHVIHWFVANIPDSKPLSDGEEVVPYLQPIPFYGTGYHRIAFILFRHAAKMDFSSYKKEDLNMLSRKFDTYQFFLAHQQELTPSAVKFCQMKWDESCDKRLHEMGMKSPRYWYNWNEALRPKQAEYPKKPMPFDKYLSMYRDPKAVRKDIWRQRLDMLANLPPGKKLEQPKYPDILYADNAKKMPYWAHMNLLKKNRGEGIYAALYRDHQNPVSRCRLEQAIQSKDTTAVCGVTNAQDGSEDDAIHCLKPDGAIPEGRKMLAEARAGIDIVLEEPINAQEINYTTEDHEYDSDCSVEVVNV
ncbi:phosphatidylethanolamine-binding protein [Ditylenchus destructor]|nr:phosphatidylethanolamine-binding protein [Ditylenchus destructor]